MSATAYPLTWPQQFPRAKYREDGRFKTALPNAIKNVQTSLRGFASDSGKTLKNTVISSNVTLGVDAPADPGVAVWFEWDGLQVCIPVDRYRSVASNLQAIHHIIEARRVELRHGTLALVRATFTGFLSLPAPAGKHWSDVLALPRDAKRADVDAAYRRLAGATHPDRGGSDAAMAELNAAREAAMKEVGHG
ncbi:MAG: heat shock protein DnaJ domain protein [Variovorax sp.]|nr:heat shock protein DnaJ domain protein [Variovorax sp.]